MTEQFEIDDAPDVAGYLHADGPFPRRLGDSVLTGLVAMGKLPADFALRSLWHEQHDGTPLKVPHILGLMGMEPAEGVPPDFWITPNRIDCVMLPKEATLSNYPFLKDGHYLRLADFYRVYRDDSQQIGFARALFHKLVTIFSQPIDDRIMEIRKPQPRGVASFGADYRYEYALRATILNRVAIEVLHQELTSKPPRKIRGFGGVAIEVIERALYYDDREWLAAKASE